MKAVDFHLLTLAALVAVVAAFASQVAKADFLPATNYETLGIFTDGISAADFNDDGLIDIITTNFGSDNVSIFLNTGGGSFAVPDLYPAASPLYSAIADLDNDGDVDIALSGGGSNELHVLLNNGDGTFADVVDYAAGTFSAGITGADFDGDGDHDIAVGNTSSNNVSIFLNGGDGTFAAAVNYAGFSGVRRLTSADFDLDGDVDIAVANYTSHQVSIILNDGAGVFGAATNYGVGTNPVALTSADFDLDGDADLAVGNYSSSNVSVLFNDGAGVFGAATNYGVGTGPRGIVTADFDGDRYYDLAVSNLDSDNFSSLLNNGDTTFSDAVNYATGVRPFDLAVADFNNDGNVDVAVANQTSRTVSVFISSTLLNVDVEPRSLVRGISGTVDVSFTTQVALPADGRIRVTFPTEFDVSGASAGACSTMDGSFATSVSGQTVTIIRSSGTLQAPAAEACTIDNVRNPQSSGSGGTYAVATVSASLHVMEQDAAVAADTFSAPGVSMDTTPPGPVTGVTAVLSDDGTSAVLSWTNPTDTDLAGVRVLRSTVSGTQGMELGQTLSGLWTDTGLASGTIYYYQLRPFDTNGNVRIESTEYVPVRAPVLPLPEPPPEPPPPAAPVFPSGLLPGDLLHDGTRAVYYLASDGKRHVFPTEPVFLGWYPDFSGVRNIGNDVLASVPLGSNVALRPGTFLLKIASDPRVYVVEPGNVLRWIPSEDFARSLYGDGWAERVRDVDDTLFENYVMGTGLAVDEVPPGSVLADGIGGYWWIVRNGTAAERRHLTRAVLDINRFPLAFVLAPRGNLPPPDTEIIGYEDGLSAPIP